MHDRASARGVVVVEDRLTERFFRRLLGRLGFDPRRIRFITAPAGKGAAEAWVRLRYPNEVRVLRSKNYQHDLFLLAVRDGDRVGPDGRKRELDEELVSVDMDKRRAQERIATPVPTWSIETWLLWLNGRRPVDENSRRKEEFRDQFRGQERRAIEAAVAAWVVEQPFELPSMIDGQDELGRIDPS